MLVFREGNFQLGLFASWFALNIFFPHALGF